MIVLKALLLLLLSAVLMLLAACEGGGNDLKSSSTSTVTQTASLELPTPTPEPLTPIPELPAPTPDLPASAPELPSDLDTSSVCTISGDLISNQREYLGPLIDAHVHLKIWGFTYPIGSLIDNMDQTGIIKVVVHDDSKTAMGAYDRFPERILPFVRIGSPQAIGVVANLKNQLKTGNFYGIGEVSLRHWSRRVDPGKAVGTSVESQKRQAGGGKGVETPADSDNMKQILDVAAQYGVPVTVHLDNPYSNELGGLLEHNRQGTVIWAHAGTTPLQMTDPKVIKQMLDEHPNLYVDLSAVSPYMKRPSLLNADGNLDEPWEELFDGDPDRFFFGIDVFLEEHLDSMESEVRYWRKVLGQLEPEIAQKIGCSNIEKLTSSKPIPTTMPTPRPMSTPILVLDPLPASLSFVPDEGIRIDFASLAKARIGADGLIYLFYDDTSSRRLKDPVASSADGLVFTTGKTSDGSVRHPYAIELPDGTWRQYILTKNNVIESKSSVDGSVFTTDEGIRYSPSKEDKGTLGTYDVFVDPNGGVVLLYVGDLRGVNNVRMAYSPPGDNGWTFSYERGNILGDDQAGGGGRTYVDIKSLALLDGRRRLFAMKGGGQILSFISDIELTSFSLEQGIRLRKTDYTEFEVVSFHDPMVIQLPSKRYRMYLHLHIMDAEGVERTVIVSATTPYPSS